MTRNEVQRIRGHVLARAIELLNDAIPDFGAFLDHFPNREFSIRLCEPLGDGEPHVLITQPREYAFSPTRHHTPR